MRSSVEAKAMVGNVEPSGRAYTVEEFERLPEDDRYRFELVRGRLVREPAPVEEHGWLEVRLGRFLDEFVEAHGLGLVVGNVGYVLEEAPAATVRAPDLSFIARARLEGGYPVRRFRRLAPDLAVEIVSPSNRVSELEAKARELLAAGVRLVWIVDPLRRTVTICEADAGRRVLHEEAELDGGEVLPGFRLPLARLFAV
jgi:Uma2 family endonuclease